MSGPEFIPDPDPAETKAAASSTPSVRVETKRPEGNDSTRPKRQVAAMLGIFFGFTGAHHFYLGSTGAGLALLATFCCGIGAIVGVVEGAMLLAMSDVEFEEKYVLRRPESLEFVFQERS